VSEVVRVTLPLNGPAPTLTLSKTLPVPGLWEYPFVGPMFKPEEEATVNARIKPFAFTSPTLGAFMGRPVRMRGLVLTPEGYDKGQEQYPVVYFTHGFTAGMTFLADQAVNVMRQTRQGRLPPMIWAFLDESGPTGTHEFADGVNNGPWGQALTSELIPDIERRYRTDNAASGRFLTGHSSGGWAALWLQINYPKLFGGAWATAPDFCDFTNFWGTDLTQPDAPMKEVSWERVEAVLGEYGGQMSSFEWVFSPRGPDGRPMPLYDRTTRVIDPQVAAFWRRNWDISQIIRNRWADLAPDLDGKVRVIVGDRDEADLDDSARRLQAAFKAVGGRASFTYVPGKGHFDLYAEGTERMALRRKIAWEVWKVARPNSPLTDPGPPTPASPTPR
jgi:pimeloyl-ACP methyl ester carboxylesterase